MGYSIEGLLISDERGIKSKEEIMPMLGATWLPKEIVSVYFIGHQRGESMKVQGNREADLAAKKVSLEPMGSFYILMTLPELEFAPMPTLHMGKKPNGQEGEMPKRRQMSGGFCQVGNL